MVFSIVSDKSLLLFSVVIITRAFCAMACKEVNSNKPTRKKFFAKRIRLFRFLIQVSQAQKLKELKELSLPTVAEELRQQSFWHSFLSSKTYVLTP